MAGDDDQSVTEGRYLTRGVHHLGWIARTLKDLQGTRTVIRELVQNADDAPGATRLRFEVTDDALVIWNDGAFEKCDDVDAGECTWLESGPGRRCDFHSFRAISSGDKRLREGVTGAFGIGFTAVYQITDRPVLRSNGLRWEIDEMEREDRRVWSQRIDPEAGTTFELPWARTESPFRREIRQPAVTDTFVAAFGPELLDELPHSLLFLRKLEKIEAVVGGVTHRVERLPVEDGVLIADGGGSAHWLLLEGDLDDRGRALVTTHPTLQATRSVTVRVAIPAEVALAGRLYATLPTEEASHLPVHIDGSFYPVSDRKRIDFDYGPEAEWNEAILRCAARVLADSLEPLAVKHSDRLVTELLLAAHDVHERATTGDVPKSFAVFWETVTASLPFLSIVPRQIGGHGTPVDVRLWSDPVEGDAADALSSLGIELVDAAATASWWALQRKKVPIQPLRLDHLVAGCQATGLTERRERDAMPGVLTDSDALDRLWAVADLLVAERSSEKSRNELRNCSLAPGTDGAIWPLFEADRFEPELLGALHRLGARPSVLDVELLGRSRVALLGVTDEVEVWQVVGWAEEVPADGEIDESAAALVLAWLHERRDELDEDEAVRLAGAPIFPTPAGRRPLRGLALPGQFEDPLGLAGLLDLTGVERMAEWFHALGAEPLTLATYCTDHLATAVEAGTLAETDMCRVIRFLARSRYEFEDDAGVHDALVTLPLVRCTDGDWRVADRTYLPHDFGPILPEHVHVADLPERDRAAHSDLYQWLGAAAEPRAEDVVDRCRELEAGPPSHRDITEAVLRHLRDVLDSEGDATAYEDLRDLPWLPVRGGTGGVVPSGVHRTNQSYLFESQGTFIDLPRPVEDELAPSLRWLGVQGEPATELVVRHLLYAADRNEPVNKEVWTFLNRHADDEALSELDGTACLYVDKVGYVEARTVFWEQPPFGDRRFHAGEGLEAHRELLDRLGVRRRPLASDAIAVLREIAEDTEDEVQLDERGLQVVAGCWRLLSEALRDATAIDEDGLLDVDRSAVAALCTSRVVPDTEGILRPPTAVFLLDSISLGKLFSGPVCRRFIPRVEGIWLAQQVAGVADLSDAVETDVLDEEPLLFGGLLPQRLEERRGLLRRVFSHHLGDPIRPLAAVDVLELHRNAALRIRHRLAVDGDEHPSIDQLRRALYDARSGVLRWTELDGVSPGWLEVAKELSRVVSADETIVLLLEKVLAAPTANDVGAALDEIGVPVLETDDLGSAEPAAADDLGGDVGDRDVEDGHLADEDVLVDAPSMRKTAFEGQPPAPADGVDVGQDQAADSDDGGVSEGEAEPEGELAGAGPTDSQGSGAGSRAGRLSRAETAAGGQQGAGPRDSSTKSTGSSSGKSGDEGPQPRMISYVRRSGASDDAARESNQQRKKIDAAAIAAVLRYERAAGRSPIPMEHHHPGYDIESRDAEENVRYIEVKGTGMRWAERGVAITRTQFLHGRRLDDAYWLYVVERATVDPVVHPIQNPTAQITRYVFDGGWREVAEVEGGDPGVEPLRMSRSADGLSHPIPLLSLGFITGELKANAYIEAGEPMAEGLSAVRIEDEGLGIAWRGGLAFVRPLTEDPADDSEVAVAVENPTGDTPRRFVIRLWSSIDGAEGGEPEVELTGSGSVEPIVLPRRDVEVIGLVEHTWRVDDLAVRGLLDEDDD
jgi:hypothetical protein